LQLVDELHIDVMPVLLSSGLPLLGDLGVDAHKLERLRVNAIDNGRTQLVYAVRQTTPRE
jgi:hypothetical protein